LASTERSVPVKPGDTIVAAMGAPGSVIAVPAPADDASQDDALEVPRETRSVSYSTGMRALLVTVVGRTEKRRSR